MKVLIQTIWKSIDTDIGKIHAITTKSKYAKECEHLLPVTNETFDKDFDLFNTQNGYLNLKLANLKNMTSSNTLPRYLMLNTQTNRIVLSGKNFLMTYS